MYSGKVGRKRGGEQAGEIDPKLPLPPPLPLPCPSSGSADLGYVHWASYYLKRTGKAVGPVGVASLGLGGNGEEQL